MGTKGSTRSDVRLAPASRVSLRPEREPQDIPRGPRAFRGDTAAVRSESRYAWTAASLKTAADSLLPPRVHRLGPARCSADNTLAEGIRRGALVIWRPSRRRPLFLARYKTLVEAAVKDFTGSCPASEVPPTSRAPICPDHPLASGAQTRTECPITTETHRRPASR